MKIRTTIGLMCCMSLSLASDLPATPGNLTWEMVTTTGLSRYTRDIGQLKGVLAFCDQAYAPAEDDVMRVPYLQNYAFKSKLAKKYTRNGLSTDDFLAAMESLGSLLKEVEVASIAVTQATLAESAGDGFCSDERVAQVNAELVKLDAGLKGGKALKK